MEQLIQNREFIHYPVMPSKDKVNCFMATLECYAQHNNIVEDFSLSHFEHAFYLKNSDSNNFSSTHSNFGIDTAWACNNSLEMMSDRVVNRLRERCGLAISLEMIFSADGLIQRINEMNNHLVCIFDPFYLRGSINYGVRHSLSVCIVNGYNEKTDHFGLLERKNGQSYVTTAELKSSTEYFIRSKGSCHIFHLTRIPCAIKLDQIDILPDLERILTHFHSSNEDEGLSALYKFQKRYNELLSYNKSFIIPWAERCFGERYANARFLHKLVQGGHPAAKNQPKLFTELIANYNSSGDLWRSFEVFHIYSVEHNQSSILQRNLTIIEEIIEHEKHSLQLLRKLQESLT